MTVLASEPGKSRPVLRLLSLGAGVQSTAVLLLACERVIPPFDYALFADTGWEPRAVHETLSRLRERAAQAGIPIRMVSAGNIRTDALNGTRRFVSMPLHVLNPDGSKGLARRQCTSEYKIEPLKKAARELLGYPHPQRVPAGTYAEQAIGISVDEFHRAKDARVNYLHNVFPLIDLGWTRDDCHHYLAERGFGQTVKSACAGRPFGGNERWRWLRDHDPDAWAQAVELDKALATATPTPPMAGSGYAANTSCTAPAGRWTRSTSTHPPTAAGHYDQSTMSPTRTAAHPGPAAPARR